MEARRGMKTFVRLALGAAVGLAAASAAHAGEPKALILSPNGTAASCFAAAKEARYGRERLVLCQRWRDDNYNARREYGTRQSAPRGRDTGSRR
jgi:hypothetical protein